LFAAPLSLGIHPITRPCQKETKHLQWHHPALDHFNNDKLLHINTYWRRHYLIKRYCGLSAWAHKALNSEIHYVPRKLSIPKSASSPQIVCL
jgi:hypothetical protein